MVTFEIVRSSKMRFVIQLLFISSGTFPKGRRLYPLRSITFIRIKIKWQECIVKSYGFFDDLTKIFLHLRKINHLFVGNQDVLSDRPKVFQ